MAWLRKLQNRTAPALRWGRAWLLRSQGVYIAPRVRVEAGVVMEAGHRSGRPGEISLEEGAAIDRGAVLRCYGGSITLGRFSYVGPYCVLYGHGGLEIGRETLLGPHCILVAANHDFSGKERAIRSRPSKDLPIRVGADCWLGAGVKVLGGVTIGDGSIVGAGAVVTHDLPPYSIAVGVPAKVRGQRR